MQDALPLPYAEIEELFMQVQCTDSKLAYTGIDSLESLPCSL